MQKLEQKNINIKAVFLFMAIFGLLVFGAEKISAVSVEDCSSKSTLAEQESCKKDLKDKADDIRELIDLKTKQENVLQNQLQLINLEQQKNSTEFKNAQQKLAELTQQIYDLENQIYEKEKLVTQQKSILSALMRSYQESFKEGVSGVVLISSDISTIFSQSDYFDQLSSKINEVLQFIRETKQNMENEKSEMENKKEESEKVKEDLKKRGLSLQSNEDQKETQVTKTQAEKSKYEQLLSDINNEIYQLEAGKGEADLSSLPPLKKGYFTYPVNPIVVTQSYGCLVSNFARASYPSCKSGSKTGGFHNGVDFSIKYGKLYAARSGKILATGNNGRYAYGKWVAIDHGDGLVTLYGHLSEVKVSKGKSVSEGDVVGISGSTGYSTGPHLHFTVFSKSSFEIKESTKVDGLMLPVGSSVSPMRYL